MVAWALEDVYKFISNKPFLLHLESGPSEVSPALRERLTQTSTLRALWLRVSERSQQTPDGHTLQRSPPGSPPIPSMCPPGGGPLRTDF